MKKVKPVPSQQELQEEFDYTDGNLYWKKTNTNRVKVGSKVGWVHIDKRTGKQYIQVGFKKKYYLIHRLIWAWHGNFLEPNEDIDHIDGNSLNNCIENLIDYITKYNDNMKIDSLLESRCKIYKFDDIEILSELGHKLTNQEKTILKKIKTTN